MGERERQVGGVGIEMGCGEDVNAYWRLGE